MNTNISISIEPLLFEYVSYIKKFHTYLQEKYQLTDIPYNVSGKAFAKTGSVIIDSVKVDYRFHGQGCTLYCDKFHINFDVDASSIHQTIVSPGAMDMFLKSRIESYDATSLSSEIRGILEEFEKKGIFMKRKPSDLGTFHVNELWYDSYKNHEEFTGANKNDIDWI